MSVPEFVPFPKIARFAREVIVTEKLDGTNAQVHVADDGRLFAGSRNRWIDAATDNFGFLRWVMANGDELRKLGPGSHFGEWWGAGIQRRYGLTEKRFSLFNVHRWDDPALRPACCGVVPTLWRGNMEALNTQTWLDLLAATGSVAAPGFMNAEGIVVFHVASGQLFKRTLHGDETPKSVARGGGA